MDSWQYFIIGAALVVVVAASALSIIYHTLKIGISPMPTSPRVKQALVEALPPPDAFPEGTLLFDLGSGWGTLLVTLAKRYPRCHIVGVELSPVPYFFCRLHLLWAGTANVSLIQRDFFEVNLTKAALVTAYLFPSCMNALGDKLKKELAPGTRVITHTFAIPEWRPDHVHRASDLYHTPVYVYHT